MLKSLRGVDGLWFKLGVASGLLLALVSVVVAVATYRFVAGHLALDHLTREAGRFAAVLEYRSREEGVETPAQLTVLLEEVLGPDEDKVAWLRILDRHGATLAETDDNRRGTFDRQDLRDVLELRRRNVIKTISTPRGKALAAILPFRFQLRSEFGGLSPGEGPARPGRFKLVEVALYFRGASEAFSPLKRNLAVGIAAPIALLGALVFLILRFPAYLRGRELEHQLALAHRVQKELLPAETPGSDHLEVASEFLPFWGVGGDYFDVFTLDSKRTFVVLGDVSGKGLPAAVIMGLLHGAVRSAVRSWDGSNHDVLAGELNRLLCANTASNRFVTFFWACYEGERGRLRYINAGHNPPLLVRRSAHDPPSIEELATGGPVLGLLPGATYEKGDTELRPGDLLVLFSDGVVEAASSDGVEFGQQRIEDALREHADLLPGRLKEEILRRLTLFRGSEPLHDDLTLLIVRAGPSRSADGQE